MVGRSAPVGTGATGAARAVDDYLSETRPDLARGRWIYEWHVEHVLPDADLTALRLDLAARQAAGSDPVSPRDLLADDRFRRVIGVHEDDGVTWFNREAFESAVKLLGLPRRADLVAAAKQSHYQLDELTKVLAEPPTWASTRPPRPAPRGGRSANKRDQSLPTRPAKTARAARTTDK